MTKLKTTLIPLCLFVLTVSLLGYQQSSIAGQETAPSAQHGDASERLVGIMRNLFSAVHEEDIVHEENVPGDKSITSDQLADMIEAVEELVFYAEVMSTKIPATELEENDAVIFSAMAQRLYDEALNVKQLATNYDYRVAVSAQQRLFNESYRRLNRTCAACHQLFRDSSPQG